MPVRFTCESDNKQWACTASINGTEIEFHTPIGTFSTKVPGRGYSKPSTDNTVLYYQEDPLHCKRMEFFLGGSLGPATLTLRENMEPGRFDSWVFLDAFRVTDRDCNVYRSLWRLLHEDEDDNEHESYY